MTASETAQEAAALARPRARELLRALADAQKKAASGLSQSRSDLKAIVIAAVEGIEALSGIVEAFGETLPAASAQALATAVQGAWERLELAGVVRDGTVGETLDLARHKVVKRRASAGTVPDTVVQVLSPGIGFGKERLREAAVVVSRAEKSDAPDRD